MRILKYTIFLSMLSGFALFTSCDKMEDNYMEFVDGGEIIYLGKADSVQTFSGRNRIKVSWLLLSDPKINRSVIYWNEKVDSMVVEVNRTEGVDTITVMLENMAEQTYNFEIYNYDPEGHSSVKTEAIGTVYGDNYAANITNRSYAGIEYQSSSKSATIDWYGAATEAVVVEMVYTDINGQERSLREFRSVAPVNPINPFTFPVETTLPQYKSGTSFKYRTGYLPKTMAIDTFYTEYQEAKPAVNLALNKSVDKSSDSSTGRASTTVDGDPETFWQPLSSDRSDLNTWIAVDLGTNQKFDHTALYWTKANSSIASYDLLYSTDNLTWQTAFHKDSPVPAEEMVSFPEVEARYLKLSVTLSSATNVTLGEIEIFNK